MNIGKIEGGTHAGWRTVREQRVDWTCTNCDAHNKYYWVNCPNCGARPEEK